MGVAVCSDTTNYLPRALAAQNGIQEVSLYVSLDGHQQRESDILDDTDRFYDALRASGEAATRRSRQSVTSWRSGGRFSRRARTSSRCTSRPGRDAWVVQHIQAPHEAERMVQRGRELFGTEPVFVSEVGPVIGAHVGPGLLAVGGLPRELLR